MANLQNYFQEVVTCTATLKFRVQIIQKVGSSTEIKVRLNVQRRPTLDEPENIEFMNKNAKIYSVPGLKTRTFYKTVTRTPKHKKLQSRLLTPSAPTSMLGNLLGEQTMLLQMWFFIYPTAKTSCGKTFHH